jgi:hypothetical protein
MIGLFNRIVSFIDARLPIALANTRLGLVEGRPTLIALVGNHINSDTATWYLSVLVARDSDEVSASVNIQIDGNQIAVSADVSREAAVLWEASRTFATFDRSDEGALDALLSQFANAAPDLILSALGGISDTA